MESKQVSEGEEYIGKDKGSGIRIANVVLPTANEEQRWQLPKGCKSITLQLRDVAHTARIATGPGRAGPSSPPYYTLQANDVLPINNLDVESDDAALWLASTDAGAVIEIVVVL